MKRLLWSVAALAVVGLSGCSGTDPEVRAQLDEIAKEMRLLSQEVAQIRIAVSEMHREMVVPGQVAAAAPVAATTQVSLDGDDPVLGSENASIAIIEFSDYECPFCQRFFTDVFPRLKTAYIDSGKVRYIARDYPLSFHPQANNAAYAANCAHQQQAYLPMRGQIVANLRDLHDGIYAELADSLNLNTDRLAQCMTNPAIAREVAADYDYAQSMGVRGTPTFFIGRVEGNRVVEARRVVGAQGYQIFANIIDGFIQTSG